MAVRNGETGLGAAAGRVADHARRLVTLEIELARNELKRKAGMMAFGAGLGVAAVIVALLAITLLVATVAAALALALADPAAGLHAERIRMQRFASSRRRQAREG